MRIGYSFWGFLGSGVTDTPDGGRSHRLPLIRALIERGHEMVFLQSDRDRLEAGDPVARPYRFDDGYPELDALVVEWRWRIEGRNTTPCNAPGHTCDLHRQTSLLRRYTGALRTPTVIWDKDRRLRPDDGWRASPGVVVCEAALHPTPGAHRVLFPVEDALLDSADPRALARTPRDLPLVYAGNQYDRDNAFDRFFAPVAARVDHRVLGKWTNTARWPHIRFVGRQPFPDVARFHHRSLATVLLLPDRYAAAGQMTQRLFEAVLAGCLPLAPATIRDVHRFVPAELVVRDGDHATAVLEGLLRQVGSAHHVGLLRTCLDRLALFRLSEQVERLELAITAAIGSAQSGAPC
ncbi:hypothetical protein [Kitasatospora sp. LaBMicrA B282]|uniref:hypothetical protein n=1 Tax=Kitasatospora sp. LaBMicrA B282 TaxID=3420949 RepID=UPI003D0C4D5F